MSSEPRRNIMINSQYLKDLSFENPNAPESFSYLKEPPQINVSVNVKVNTFDKDLYEVALQITATAKAADKNIFLVEMNYAGLFTINVPEEEKEQVLMIYCPNVIFPFARRIIADSTRDGGFPPLMIDPVDFAGLYYKHKSGESKS